jgi:hypothetical protein
VMTCALVTWTVEFSSPRHLLFLEVAILLVLRSVHGIEEVLSFLDSSLLVEWK